MKKLILVGMCVMLAIASPSFARERTIKLGTGSATGTYFKMADDIEAFCGDAVKSAGATLSVEESGGSISNLTGLMEKKYSAGIVQEDVLQYFAKQDPGKYNGNRVKVVSGLHIETVHLIIPKGWQPRKAEKSAFDKLSAFMSGEDDSVPVEMSLYEMEGQQIAVKGGAIVSAKALKHYSGVDFEIVEVAKDAVWPASMPRMIVAGVPYTPVADMLKTGKFKLVSLSYAELASRAPFYVKSSLNYLIGGKTFTAPSIGIRALLVGKSSRREERNAPYVALAQCIDDSLIEFDEDDTTSPNWQSVLDLEDSNAQSPWPYFPLK